MEENKKPLCQWCKKEEASVIVSFKEVIQFKDAVNFLYYAQQYCHGDYDEARFRTIEETVICSKCYALISKKEPEKPKIYLDINTHISGSIKPLEKSD